MVLILRQVNAVLLLTGTGSGNFAPISSDSFISCGHTMVGTAEADAARAPASSMRIIAGILKSFSFAHQVD